MKNVEFVNQEMDPDYFTGEFGEIVLGILQDSHVQSLINGANWQELLNYLTVEDRRSNYGGVESTICETLLRSGINILDGITEITDNFLLGASDLKSMRIPDTVERIGKQAFSSCIELVDVYIPRSVTAIDNYAFDNCSNDLQVHYNGTTTDWSHIKFGEYVFEDSVVVHCTDGIAS